MSVAERRGLLLDAATRVLTRDGVANTTTRSIVAEAGMPLGVFHYCFRSKEELLEHVIQRFTETVLDAVLPTLQEDGSLREVIHEGLLTFWTQVEAEPELHQLTNELNLYALRVAPSSASRLYDGYARSTDLFLGRVVELTRHEWVYPLDVVSRLTLAVAHGLRAQWLVDRDTVAVLAVLEAFSTQLAAMGRPMEELVAASVEA